MLIFATYITPRLEYTLKHVFSQQLRINYSITDQPEVFESFAGDKINYSTVPLSSKIQITPVPLLFEDVVTHEQPQVFTISDIPVLFAIPECALGFDVFAAVFWMLSRFEEYQPFMADNHQRFPGTASLAFNHNFHKLPVVDIWIGKLRTLLQETYPHLVMHQSTFTIKTTIDVDSPWCYKHKGFFRQLAGFSRDLIKGKGDALHMRLKVLFHILPDPWFVFDDLRSKFDHNPAGLMFFIHVGDYGIFDKTVSYNHKEFKKLITLLGEQFEIALHPSYRAADNPYLLADEIRRLEQLTHNKIVKSRQHYLKIQLPGYYRRLINSGITHDFSMGFADIPGFRAGTSQPFAFFDLLKNKETILTVHPFVVMDRTLKTYMNQNPDNALETLKEILHNVKAVNGTFVSLWHNESLSNTFEWVGWQRVFNEFIQYQNRLQ